jgi:hypothetical protein
MAASDTQGSSYPGIKYKETTIYKTTDHHQITTIFPFKSNLGVYEATSKMTTSPPSPTSITHPQFIHLVSLYPSVVKRVYEAKIKDAKKLAQVFEDDAWRYEGLVKLVKGRRGKDDYAGGWLEKAELERLVRWKM